MTFRVAAIACVVACSGHTAPPTGNGASSDETLAFEVDDGSIRNYFYRRGPVAAHVLLSSGDAPRLIVAFPAGNTGIGLWFDKPAAPVRFEVEGSVTGVERDRMRGVTAMLSADADRLEVRGAVLGSIRTLRDYAQLATQPPETLHQVSAGPLVVLRRTTADNHHSSHFRAGPRHAGHGRDGHVTIEGPHAIHVRDRARRRRAADADPDARASSPIRTPTSASSARSCSDIARSCSPDRGGSRFISAATRCCGALPVLTPDEPKRHSAPCSSGRARRRRRARGRHRRLRRAAEPSRDAGRTSCARRSTTTRWSTTIMLPRCWSCTCSTPMPAPAPSNSSAQDVVGPDLRDRAPAHSSW
jgi:hypothetical protein